MLFGTPLIKSFFKHFPVIVVKAYFFLLRFINEGLNLEDREKTSEAKVCYEKGFDFVCLLCFMFVKNTLYFSLWTPDWLLYKTRIVVLTHFSLVLHFI